MVDHVMLEGLARCKPSVLRLSLLRSVLCGGSKKCLRLRPDTELCLMALAHLSFGLGLCPDSPPHAIGGLRLFTLDLDHAKIHVKPRLRGRKKARNPGKRKKEEREREKAGKQESACFPCLC